MVGTRGLQPQPDLVWQAGAIANQHRGHDRSGDRVVRRHPPLNAAAHVRADGGRGLVHARAASANVDEESALDGSEERGAGERKVALEIGDALIQITGGTAKRGERFDDSPGSPLA